MATEARELVGRYELLNELGRGGTATVYLARQTDLGRLVALKELALPVTDAATGRRFVRESRLAGSLNHPNIVTVHDFFEDHGTPYIAMEYLARGSLRPLMHGLTFAQIAGVLDGLLAGLGHAQESGIVHRDLKPENLMVTADGRVKIADFGIAKVTDEALAGTMLTVKGTTIGTPTYMAPEQAMARDIGPWTDMYAVGVIAFELLTGRPPFATTGAPMAILLRHVNEPPLTLTAVDPSADPRLSDWIDQLLAKDPEARRHTAGSAWLAFEEIVLDRLGPRWRHAVRLPEPRQPGPTPATLPLMPDGDRDERAIPTAMPRAAAAAPLSATAATARPRSAQRRLRSLLLLMAVVLAVATLAIAAGNGARPTGGSSDSSPGGARLAPTSAAPARSAPAAAPRSGSSGVGDSQSDDPSDDEPDEGEP